MTKLKLGPLIDDRPVKVTVELPGPLHRDLLTYAEVLARETGQPVSDPVKLIVPMLEMGWLPPSPDGIAMCQDGGVESHEAERTAT